MNNDDNKPCKNVTINILPQNSDCWCWIALAIIAIAVTSCTAKIQESEDKLSIERVKRENHSSGHTSNNRNFRSYYRNLV